MTGRGQRHVRFFPRRTQVPTPEQRVTPWSRARTTRSTAYAMSVAARSRAAMAATASARASITPIASDSGSPRHRAARTNRRSNLPPLDGTPLADYHFRPADHVGQAALTNHFHRLDIAQRRCLVEERFLGSIQPEQDFELSPRRRGNPVRLFTGRTLRTEVDVHRTVRIFLEPRGL
jgi:hypothetical protein